MGENGDFSDVSITRGLVYLDTNVVSVLANPANDWFLSALLGLKVRPVVSDTVLAELQRGVWERERNLFERFQILLIYTGHALPTGKLSDFYVVPMHSGDAEPQSFVDNFVEDLLLWSAGNPSAPSLNQTFENMFEAAMDMFQGELDTSDNPEAQEAKALLKKARPTFGGLFRGLEIPILSKVELEEAGIGPKYFSWMQPPGVVRKVLASTGAGSSALAEHLQTEIEKTDDVRERVRYLASLLLTMGFARDNRLAKDDPEKSRRGARSQWSDIDHIAAAATCTLFLTQDRRCARLAYAIYEYLDIKCGVVWLNSTANDQFVLVGPSAWP